MSRLLDSDMRPCPHCEQYARRSEEKCPHCGVEIAAPATDVDPSAAARARAMQPVVYGPPPMALHRGRAERRPHRKAPTEAVRPRSVKRPAPSRPSTSSLWSTVLLVVSLTLLAVVLLLMWRTL